ncbi:MAG: RHS repeat-associated core domain-containing protein, partial [bacterium]
DARGLVTQYGYASNGLIRTVTSPGGLIQTTVNNIDGRPFSTSENGILKTRYDYGVNSDGTQWSKVYSGPAGTNSPMWSKTTAGFLGRPVKEEKPGFGGTVLTNSYVYNTKGQLASTTQQPNNSTTLSEFDELGNQIRSGIDVNDNGLLDLAGPDRVSETIRRYIQRDGDWYDETLSLVYPNASAVPVTNAISRSSAGGLSCGCAVLKSESVDILGNVSVSETVMDPAHRLVTKTVRSPFSTNAATSVTYNGLPVESASATGIKTIYTQDALGRQISALQGGSGALRTVGSYTAYDALGRVESTMDAASNMTVFTYDFAGRRSQVTDALSNSTYTAYDPQGRVLATWGATYPVAYEYDDFGRMTAMYTYRGASAITSCSAITNLKSAMDRTTWSYDLAIGLLTNKLYSDGHGPSYTYTPDGKLATRTWVRGVVTAYNYDGLGQLTNISYSDNTPAVAFTYNRLGQQDTITDGTGTRLFSYTDAFQLASETNTTAELVRIYDSQGRPAGYDLVTVGSTSVVSSIRYDHDSLGRFSSLSNNVGGALRAATYSSLPGSDLLPGYDIFSGGTAASLSVTRSFESRRNLITQILNTSGTNLVSQFDYVNDAVGRRTQRVDSSSLTNDFGYNSRSELIEALMGTNNYAYRYDPIGNRTVATNNGAVTEYQANALNQYSQITNNHSPITPAYDLDGNMTAYHGWAFAWDAENRMTGASNESAVANYSYDYMSRRYRKIVNGVTNNFVYDGWNLVRETSSAGVTNTYVWGLDLSGTQQGAGGIGGLLSVTRNGSTYFPCYDANGNITDYVDASGAVVAHREYDAYGNTVASSGPMVDDFSFWFSSKYLDRETGLYYYGKRYYGPELGKWLNRDPLDENGGWNLYLFAQNNAVSKYDYLGMNVPFFDCQTLASLEAQLENLKTQAMALEQMRVQALAALRNPLVTTADAQYYRSILQSIPGQMAQISAAIASIAATLAGAGTAVACCCVAGAGAAGAGAGCVINNIPVGGGHHVIDWFTELWHWIGF